MKKPAKVSLRLVAKNIMSSVLVTSLAGVDTIKVIVRLNMLSLDHSISV